jgi:hypothetical protein
MRGVPARANPDQPQASPGQPVGRRLGRRPVGEQAGELVRLRLHGFAHLSTWRTLSV